MFTFLLQLIFFDTLLFDNYQSYRHDENVSYCLHLAASCHSIKPCW